MSSSAPKSSVPSGSIRGTVLGRDGGSVRSTAHLDPSVFSTRSLLTTPEDVKMASKMSQFKSMTPTQQKKQQSWFDGYAKDSKCCPENNEWVRADSGMICSEGGHGMTDEMIEEGLGAICAMPKGCKGDWSKRCGPYYQVADKGPKGEAMWKFNKGIKFPGVVPPKEK
ncbi:uncharacterized protein LY89DRAFT_650751 [Mollisia scopiformis]|uniref:Uncharacterized protein n=1 Tax=Mollisia scopiformis TaxID=149040 RepID=A0A194X1B6_MOLSC|nr:uncharacterized protein LY89DRAFT_650751 [Mollisia scopiformis]KUJ13764.1 hypothetical protein LY89DRAFT_650751 [Mollisia scopiformis]